MNCSGCGAKLMEGALFCIECGKRVEKTDFCPFCNAKLMEGAWFCINCGKKIDGGGDEKDNISTVSLDDTSSNAIETDETKHLSPYEIFKMRQTARGK